MSDLAVFGFGGLELEAFENASGDFAKDRRIVDDEHLCH
jgi:hypothetical protein